TLSESGSARLELDPPVDEVVTRNSVIVEIVRSRRTGSGHHDREHETSPTHRLHGVTSPTPGAKTAARRSGSMLPPEAMTTTGRPLRGAIFPASNAAVVAAPEPST